MANFLTFLLVIFLIIFLLGVGFVSRFIRIITKQSSSTSNNRQHRSRSQNNYNSDTEKATNGKKVFPKEEGEYIDYEEIKDN